jgi:hypothetical protein
MPLSSCILTRGDRDVGPAWGSPNPVWTAGPTRASIYENDGRSPPSRIEPSCKDLRPIGVLGTLAVADFNPCGQKLQEDADPDRQEPTLPKIDSMQFVDIAGIELLKNRHKSICGDILSDDERG